MARTIQALVDTNVLLDILLQRKGLVEASEKVVDAAKEGLFKMLIPAQALPTVFSIGCVYGEKKATREFIFDLLTYFDVIELDKGVCLSAYQLPISDYEDALIAETAHRFGCDYIVSRNVKDFRQSLVVALKPEGFLKLLKF